MLSSANNYYQTSSVNTHDDKADKKVNATPPGASASVHQHVNSERRCIVF